MVCFIQRFPFKVSLGILALIFTPNVFQGIYMENQVPSIRDHMEALSPAQPFGALRPPCSFLKPLLEG